MLDLTDEDGWKIKLPDSVILKVKMPTIKRMKEIKEASRFLFGNGTKEEKDKVLYDALLLIFNDNINGLVFDKAKLQGLLQPKHLQMVLEDYMKYCVELRKK